MGAGALNRTDQFAEHLANGLSINQIAERMRLTRGAAQGLMRRIRLALGSQAV